ncbi:unnamed protein product [Lasius platythorax]|uniref:Uncharacterized protein n=1 Tax=Lasius platythorax TaxID=488582 RepID=A0AAV2NI02_9HYME
MAACCVAFPVGLGWASIHSGRPTGNKALRRVVADGDRAERRGTTNGAGEMKDEGRRSWQVPGGASKLMSTVVFYARYVAERLAWP